VRFKRDTEESTEIKGDLGKTEREREFQDGRCREIHGIFRDA
jgi:hypothetical protein